MRKILDRILNQKFKGDLALAEKRANELYATKGKVVVCHYCGNLLPKSDAEVVYNIETDRMEYSHPACFDENNSFGTLEDLDRATRAGEVENNDTRK